MIRGKRPNKIRGPEKYRRLQHPWAIVLYITVSVLLMGASFGAGALVTRPQNTALEKVNTPVVITVQAQMRQMNGSFTLRGQIVQGKTVTLPANISGEIEPAVVTDAGVIVGDSVVPGSYLGSISGRPLIVLDAGIPLYRDLRLNDKGSDVEYLQGALRNMGYLGVEVTGIIDPVTLEAFRLIYSSLGLTPPGKTKDDTVFHWREFVQLPGNNGTVVSIAPIATPITDQAPFITVQISENIIATRALTTQADMLPPKTGVLVSGSDGIVESNVISVSPLLPEDTKTGSAPGKDITITLPETMKLASPGTKIEISLPTNDIEELSIPLISVQQDETGSFVDVFFTAADLDDLTEEDFKRVDIMIKDQSAGWVAIQPTSSISDGAIIRIP